MNTRCPTCGKTHTRTGSLCRRCAADAANTLELVGGQWRYDSRTHVRRWVRDLVAQTFDEGALWPAKSARIGVQQDGPGGVGTATRSLTRITPESAKTPGAKVAEGHPTSLYRYFDDNGILLYVGITSRGIKRNREHNGDKDWWPLVHSQSVEHFDTREEAERAERIAIRTMRPPYNRQHNPDHAQIREMYEALRATGLYGVNPLTIKRRGRYLELDRVGPIETSASGRQLATYVSRLEDTPVVAHIQQSQRSVPAARLGRRSTAKVSVKDGRLLVRVSNLPATPLPELATAQFRYVSQKPITFELQTIFGGRKS